MAIFNSLYYKKNYLLKKTNCDYAKHNKRTQII